MAKVKTATATRDKGNATGVVRNGKLTPAQAAKIRARAKRLLG